MGQFPGVLKTLDLNLLLLLIRGLPPLENLTRPFVFMSRKASTMPSCPAREGVDQGLSILWRGIPFDLNVDIHYSAELGAVPLAVA